MKINVDEDKCDSWSFTQAIVNGDVIMTATCGSCNDVDYKVFTHASLVDVDETYLSYCSEVSKVDECID